MIKKGKYILLSFFILMHSGCYNKKLKIYKKMLNNAFLRKITQFIGAFFVYQVIK